MKSPFIRLAILLTALLSLGLLGCTKQEDETAKQAAAPAKKPVELIYVEWASEIASTNVVKAVLQEKMGYEVKTTAVGAAAMYQALAANDADGMVGAWVPTTHGHYLEEIKGKYVDLGPNLTGTRIGLVVPTYVTIDSLEELNANADKFNGRIVGIDPGAGLMSKTELALTEYGLDNFKLIEGTGATMTAALADAIKNNQWVVVTGWTPHWKFAAWDLKYLEDPKNIFGGEEFVHTIVRQGLQEDQPEVYAFLDKFNWTPEDMATVMIWNEEEGADPYENAKRWINENPEKVAEWLK